MTQINSARTNSVITVMITSSRLWKSCICSAIGAAFAVPSLLPPSRRWGRALALLLPVGVVFIFLPIGPSRPGGDEADGESPLAVTRTS